MSQPEAENFDRVHPEPEKRAFIIGGETFHWRPIWWRDFGEMVDTIVDEQLQEAEEEEKAKAEAEQRGEPVEEPVDRVKLVDTYEGVIKRILIYLEPSEVERFQAVVNDPGRSVSQLQLTELRDWLQEVQNNRPTAQPLPSDAGPGDTARISRVA